MLETPDIPIRDVLEAAAALDLTNADIAARLGVDVVVFNRILAEVKTIKPNFTKAHAAAAAMIEEANRMNGAKTDEKPEASRGRQGAKGPGNGAAGHVDDAAHANARGHHFNGHAGDADDRANAGADRSDDRANHADADDRANAGADGSGNAYCDLDAAGLIAAAAAVAGHPDVDNHAYALLRAAGAADLDAAQIERFVEALSRSWDVGKRAVAKLLKSERDAYLADQGVAGGEKPTAADLLLGLVEKAGWKTWKDRRTDEAVVTIAAGQHLPVRGRLLRQALIRLWTNKRPDGRRVCPTEAAALKPTIASVVRYAAAGDNQMAPDGVVVDFGDDTFEALFITPNGLTVICPEAVDAIGIRFVRPMLMSELPRPKSDATPQDAIDSLSQLISLDQTTDQKLVFGVLVASLLPLPAVLPVIVLAAPQGSGKTAVGNGLKSVLDPAVVGASAMPKTRDDLVVRLSKARCVVLDNVSSLHGETSDLLCIASTGGNSTRRTLYTDDDEIALRLHATLILTAIDESIFGRSDLLSRAVILGLTKPPGGQHSERQMQSLWTAALPVVLGGLYAALSQALDKINWSGKSAHGRLAASVQVLEALDAAGVCGGGFVSVYASSQQAAAGDFVLRDEMLREIIRTVLKHPASPIDGAYSWLGSAAALYAAIGGNRHHAGKDWPRSESALTRRLKYLAPALDQVGVVVEYRRTNKARSIEIAIDVLAADVLRTAAARAGSPFPDDLEEAEFS